MPGGRTGHTGRVSALIPGLHLYLLRLRVRLGVRSLLLRLTASRRGRMVWQFCTVLLRSLIIYHFLVKNKFMKTRKSIFY